MELEYTHFVAYATLQAYEQLQTLLSKWRTDVTQDILNDAAKFGHQRATERLFPGVERLPFTRAPLQDIIAALKLQYAVAAPVAANPDESSRRTPKVDSQPVTRLTENIRTPISGQYRVTGSSRVEGMYESRRGTDGSEVLPMPDESSHPGRKGSSDRLARVAVTPRPGDNQGESTARIQPTKLRAITAPVFPWEKKRE